MATVASHQHTISAHSSEVNWLSFSGKTLATCSGDKTIRLWSLDDFVELPCSPLLGHTYSIHCCEFSPFDSFLATCSTDGKAILWDAKTGEKLAVFEHASKCSVRTCRFSPNSSILATGSDDESLCLWDIASKKLIRSFEGHEASVTCCAFTPDSTFVVSGSPNGDLRVWDARYGHGKNLLFILDGHDLGVTCLDFSPTYGSAGDETITTAVNHSEGVDHSAASQIHYLLATCGFDNHVKLWDFLTNTGSPNVHLKLRDTLSGHKGQVLACCFSPNGRLLASASGDKTVRLWDPLKGEAVHIIEGHSRYVTCCTFSSDGRLLATSSNDRSVMVWNVKTEGDLTDNANLEDIVLQSHTAPLQLRKQIDDWSVADVSEWIKEIGLSQYEPNFLKNAIDGAELMTLRHDSLENAIGIGALGHRNKILRAIEKITLHPVIQPKDLDSGIPDEYLCPITCEVMKDPVIAADGYTYERIAITAWINSGKTRSPMTNSMLPSHTITPNRSLKMLIQRYINAT